MEVNVDQSAAFSVPSFIAERLDIAFSVCVSKYLRECNTVTQNMKLNIWEDKMTRDLIFGLRSFVLDGHKVKHETKAIYTPSTPWEFFKQKYMPDWFLRRWPVRFVASQTVVVEHHNHYMCPHLSVPSDKPHHIYWMMTGPSSLKDWAVQYPE